MSWFWLLYSRTLTKWPPETSGLFWVIGLLEGEPLRSWRSWILHDYVAPSGCPSTLSSLLVPACSSFIRPKEVLARRRLLTKRLHIFVPVLQRNIFKYLKNANRRDSSSRISLLFTFTCWALLFTLDLTFTRGFTHSHVIPGAVAMKLNIQVREVEEHTVVRFHRNDPGTVHIVGVAVGIQRRMDFPWWSCDWTPTACKTHKSPQFTVWKRFI